MIPQNDPLAIAALVCGLLGWLSSCCGIVPLIGPLIGLVGFLLPFAAIILGIISINRIKMQPELYLGRGMAIAGIALGAGYLLFVVAMVVLVLVFGVGAAVIDQVMQQAR